MTTPLIGKLETKPAVQAKSFTLDDDVDLEMDKATPNATIFPRAFIPDADGVLSIVDGGGDIVNIPVKGGALYPIVAQRFRSTGSTGITNVIGLA